MKKSFKWVALGLCAVTLMASCKKKSSSEPVAPVTPGTPTTPTTPTTPVTPTTPPTPVDKTKGIKLVLAEGQTTFSLTGLTGDSITMEGVTGSTAITAWRKESRDFTATQAGATVVIKGNVKGLQITKGSLKTLDLSQAPSTITALISTGTSIQSVDLSGAVNLETLVLRDYEKLATLDLSKQTKLASLTLGRYKDDHKQRTLKTVVWPSSHNISLLDLEEVGFSVNTASFPGLSDLLIAGNMTMTSDIAIKNSASLKTVYLQKFTQKNLILENNPNFTKVFFDGGRSDASEKSIKITGNASLAEVTLQMVNNWAVNKDIISIDLSNNPKLETLKTLDAGNISLFTSSALRNVDLSGTAIEAKTILEIIKVLPEGDNSTRKIKLTNPSQELRDAVASKKWVLQN